MVSMPELPKVMGHGFVGGETAALERVTAYMEGPIATYAETCRKRAMWRTG